MIRGFEPTRKTEPVVNGAMQWPTALLAGLIAGVVLLIIPRGSPWASLTFFSRAIMGRVVPADVTMALPVVWVIHLALSLIYGLFISLFVAHLSQNRATLVGGLLGIPLYLINWGIVSLALPEWQGNQVAVLFTHIVFGLIAGSAYRGLLRRKAVA